MKEHMNVNHGRFHKRMYGDPRPIQCSVCKATFEKQSALITHSCYTNYIPTKTRGGDPYKCDICTKTFTVKMGLRSHLNTVHNEERNFACNACDFKAKSIIILNRHNERVHKNNLKHLCSHCGKKFFRAYDLRCHIHRVHKDRQGTEECQPCNFKCESCPERFLDKRALSWHQKKSHNIIQEYENTGP
jgi:KRAB domain-containing zinc finger protein